MKKFGFGRGFDELQQKIDKVKESIAELEKNHQPLPELIERANLLRNNEYLTKIDKEKSKLISYYEISFNYLTQLAETLLEIQEELKNLLKKHTSKQSVKVSKKTRIKTITARKKTRTTRKTIKK